MDFTGFQKSLTGQITPANVSVCLQSLWYDAQGNWQKAHELVQDVPGKEAAWVHAYLHRKEGDLWNADYWYNRAGRKRPDVALQQEWEQMVKALL